MPRLYVPRSTPEQGADGFWDYVVDVYDHHGNDGDATLLPRYADEFTMLHKPFDLAGYIGRKLTEQVQREIEHKLAPGFVEWPEGIG